VKVLDESGRRWKVRRRWLPWRRRVRDVPDTPDVGALGDDPISAIIGLFLLILAIPAIIVVLLLLAELLLLLVLLPVFVLLRLLLPVPWTVELWTRAADRRFLGWHLEHEVPVRGWTASQARIGEMVDEIAETERGRRYVPREVHARVAAGEDGDVSEHWHVLDPGGVAPVADEDRAAVARRVPGDGAPPAERGAEVAGGSPAGAAPVRPAGSTGPATPNPFAQRDD